MPYNRDEFAFEATALRGAASLKQLLDCIGGDPDDDQGDKRAVQALVSNEMPLRALLTYALDKFAAEM